MSKDKAKDNYGQKYYKKNKEKIKQYQKERYLKAKNIIRPASTNASIPKIQSESTGSSFFSITTPGKKAAITDRSIINQYRSWIYTCATTNGASVASQDLHLYATVEQGQSEQYLHKTRNVSKNKLEFIKEGSSVKSLAKIRRADNVVEILDHPLINLLTNINDNNNNFESFELTQIYLDMIGDSYWYVEKDSIGLPKAIYVLQSQHMNIIPAKGTNKFIKGYLYGNTKNSVKFRPDEIIHFKTPNPNDIYYGRGAAQSVISAITRMNSMDISEQARLDNMGRPDFLVNYKNGKLDSKEIRKLERMYSSAFGGPSKAGKIKVMDEDFDIKTIGFSPRDMEYLSGRIWSLKEIAGAFNVPYSILDTSDTKKATSELAEYWYAKNGILPRITRIQEKLNEKLVSLYDPTGRMFLMYDDPIPENRKLILEENTKYVSAGIITVNEARLKLGLASLGADYDIPTPNRASVSVSSSVSDDEVITDKEGEE